MSTPTFKRFYTPPFSKLAVVSVRRLAWALNKSMSVAIDDIIQGLPSLVDSSKVCLSCRDCSKCNVCIFSNHSANPAALAALVLE